MRDKLIAHALREAYRDMLHLDRHPAFALFLEMNADGVDVNVHPTKTEVKFRDSRALHQFIFHAINKALASPQPVSAVSMSPRRKPEQEAGSTVRLRLRQPRVLRLCAAKCHAACAACRGGPIASVLSDPVWQWPQRNSE